MEKWGWICLLLCLVGFLKEFRPNESFGVEYLVGPWQNETNDEVMQLVFPVWTYSYVALLFVVFLITDYLLYKPVVVCEALSFTIFYIILIWGYGIPAMQVCEVFYASATACDIAYSTYIYAQVPHEKFQLVTGYTQAAALIGAGLGHFLGQFLISTELCDYSTINYVSLAFVAAATVAACFLPSASKSIYFHRGKTLVVASIDKGEARTEQFSPWRLLWIDFTSSYSNPYMLKWSIWWAFAMAGNLLVILYIQALWDAINSSGQFKALNGAVEGINTIVGALAALSIGYVSIDWTIYGEAIVAVLSFFEALMLYFAATANALWVVYVAYIFFTITYRLLITIASSELAKGLKEESYGLVFGINTFVALVIQTVMTLILVDKVGLALRPQTQYLVYGGYFGVLGIAFLIMAIYNKLTRSKFARITAIREGLTM